MNDTAMAIDPPRAVEIVYSMADGSRASAKMRGCQTVLLASLPLLLASCGSTGIPAPSVDACGLTGNDPYCRTLVFGGKTRAYMLYVPPNFQPGSSALVVALNGSGGSGAGMETFTGLDFKANQVGFAVAYPYSLVVPGTDLTDWNNFFDDNIWNGEPPDDVGFLSQMITTIQDSIHPDPKEIFVTGISNGGLMTHRVGIQLSNLVAAIGVVEGTLYGFNGNVQGIPPAVAPVSVLILHGDKDTIIPCCVTTGMASQEQTFDYWTGPSANTCAVFDTTAPLCDAQGNITSVSEKDATGCLGNAEVKYYRLEGGIHTWYMQSMNILGQAPYNPAFNTTTGVTTDDILWNFFAAHSKP
jgi:polyhydroxybutyrate depolymerase